MTHPTNKVGKLDSSNIIALMDLEYYYKLTKQEILVFEEVHKTGTYLTTRATNECTKCLQHRHKWQQGPAAKNTCTFCAKYHVTNTHFCADCSAKDVYPHIAAKYINCEGEHKVTEKTCPTKLSITVV